jgi:hypothetical protein
MIATSRLPSDCSRTLSLNLILLHAVPLKAGTVYNRMILLFIIPLSKNKKGFTLKYFSFTY